MRQESIIMFETQVARWIQSYRQQCDMQVREIQRHQSAEWDFDGHRYHHKSGGFFSVVGATVFVDGRRQPCFDQPLIDQPEIGILGFLIRRTRGETEIMVQAKPEPGNVGLVQIAPTVQATRSNYMRLHRGKSTPFIDYFCGTRKSALLSDSLQSEQGTRFLSKFNRNVIAELPDDDEVSESSVLKWFSIQELLPLLGQDFQVNTDARSVLACGPWQRFASGNKPFGRWLGKGGLGEALIRSYETPEQSSASPTSEIVERLHRLQNTSQFVTLSLSLPELIDWEMTDKAIRPLNGTSLEVRQYAVDSTDREVNHWSQPLIASCIEGLAILFCQEKGGVLHFLFNCRAEIGFRECFEYGPTIQDLGDARFIMPSLGEKESELKDLLGRSTELFSSLQSDEGGRFFRCISRYSVHMLDKDEVIDLGQSLSWFTLRQIEFLVKQPGFFSNEARSLISMLLAYL